MRLCRELRTSGSFGIWVSPTLNFVVDRQAAARFGINASDIQDAVATAVGGNAVTQLLQGEATYGVVVRYKEKYRNTQDLFRTSVYCLHPVNVSLSRN